MILFFLSFSLLFSLRRQFRRNLQENRAASISYTYFLFSGGAVKQLDHLSSTTRQNVYVIRQSAIFSTIIEIYLFLKTNFFLFVRLEEILDYWCENLKAEYNRSLPKKWESVSNTTGKTIFTTFASEFLSVSDSDSLPFEVYNYHKWLICRIHKVELDAINKKRTI